MHRKTNHFNSVANGSFISTMVLLSLVTGSSDGQGISIYLKIMFVNTSCVQTHASPGEANFYLTGSCFFVCLLFHSHHSRNCSPQTARAIWILHICATWNNYTHSLLFTSVWKLFTFHFNTPLSCISFTSRAQCPEFTGGVLVVLLLGLGNRRQSIYELTCWMKMES